MNNTYTNAAEQLLETLGKNSLGSHISLIEDILTELVETCPMALSKYFSDRMIECPWSLKHTKGDLNIADEEADFCVYSDPLVSISSEVLGKKLFKDTDEDQKDVKHLPMVVHVFDFPQLHHFSSSAGNKIIEALSESDDMSVFDRTYV